MSSSAARTANLASAAAVGIFPTDITAAGFDLKFAVCVPKEYSSLKFCGGSNEAFCWWLQSPSSNPAAWRQSWWSRKKISQKILCYVLEGAEHCAVYADF